jgi:hypothetical protein
VPLQEANRPVEIVVFAESADDKSATGSAAPEGVLSPPERVDKSSFGLSNELDFRRTPSQDLKNDLAFQARQDLSGTGVDTDAEAHVSSARALDIVPIWIRPTTWITIRPA